MLYCPNCHRVFEENIQCPFCEEKAVREPKRGDIVKLLTADPESFSILAERLNFESIEFDAKPIERLGDSPFSGKAFLPDWQVFVSYSYYEKAQNIADEVFETIKLSNSPPTSKSIFSQIISVIIFILAICILVYAADFIAGLFK